MIFGFDHISATLIEIGFEHRFLNDSTAVWVSKGGSSVVVSTQEGDDEDEMHCGVWVSDVQRQMKGSHTEIASWLQVVLGRGSIS